jgi:hypothetical protein
MTSKPLLGVGDLDSEPRLGVLATVTMDDETHGPMTLGTGKGLHQVTIFPGPSHHHFSEEGHTALKRAGVDDMVLPLDSTNVLEPLVDDIEIVSVYSLHVALYALQNPTPENIAKALAKLGVSGDIEEHTDWDSLLPLPVPPPPGWDDPA